MGPCPSVCLPVGVADCALPLRSSHDHAASAADSVAAAVANRARVPELSQRPLAAGACPLPVLACVTLGSFPPQILELVFHPPEVRGHNAHVTMMAMALNSRVYLCNLCVIYFF